jgi:H+-translocating NAD(P) transhydrogenase subunit alpha
VKIGAPKEIVEGEARVAMTPDSAVQLQKLGYACVIEAGAGAAAGFSDAAYQAAGVEVVKTAAALWKAADVVAKVRPPTDAEAKKLRKGQVLISFFYPGQNEALLNIAKDKGANVIAMDMVPRISRAQKMDALSSMANIAGYRAVIEAGSNFGRFFTGQVTAAGKVPPAKVLVVGAGVAGLAAIGTATSLGAIVYAFDVRPEVAEQIESMGANFVFLEFEQTQDGAATGGYAAPSSPEFREKQLAKFRELAPEMDIVITTALIPGRPAPKLWTEDMVGMMKRGSVIVDLAAERGGNCDLTVPDQKIVTEGGVTIVGYTDFPSPHGRAVLDALFHEHPPHDVGPDARQGRRAGPQHGGRRDPGGDGHLRGRRHLAAAAAQGAGDRGRQAQGEAEGADARREAGPGGGAFRRRRGRRSGCSWAGARWCCSWALSRLRASWRISWSSCWRSSWASR